VLVAVLAIVVGIIAAMTATAGVEAVLKRYLF